MREHAKSFESKGVSLVAVVPSDSNQLKQFLEVYGPYPFNILGDPNRNAYKDLQLKRVAIFKALKIVFQYVFTGRFREIFPKDPEQKKVIKKAMSTQDVYQLGGTWLIEPSGKILWKHIDTEPSDHASVQTILSVIDKHVQ